MHANLPECADLVFEEDEHVSNSWRLLYFTYENLLVFYSDKPPFSPSTQLPLHDQLVAVLEVTRRRLNRVASRSVVALLQ